jgi:hypothetical protein
MAEPAAEIPTAELTKAEQKKKDEELTPAELMAFGILPPQPENPIPAKSPERESPKDGAVSSARSNDGSK